jgi:ADP-ribosylglycohydrolase
LGGDTDTNACIVGVMIGALTGLKNIPEKMLDTLLKFDCTA